MTWENFWTQIWLPTQYYYISPITCEWVQHWDFFNLFSYGLEFDMVRVDTCVDNIGGVWDSNMTHTNKYSTIKQNTYGINAWKCSFPYCFDPPILFCIPYLDIFSCRHIDHICVQPLTRIAWRNKVILPFIEVAKISFWNN